jgi:serine/threonine protein kinase
LNFLKDENELIDFCKQISSGLDYLHTDFRLKSNSISRPPIAHRDLKSDNIIIKQNRLLICDFALAILLDENEITPNEQQQVLNIYFLFLQFIFRFF